MNAHASISATTTRSLSLSALLQVLPAPTSTRCQNAAESAWKFFHARRLSDVWSAVSIWTLAASDAINSIAAPRSCAYNDSGVDSEIRRVLIDWSVLGARHFAGQPLLALPQRGLGLLGLGDVADNLGAADDPARMISQRRDRQ